jgi:Protein of unknown function (DUF4232)
VPARTGNPVGCFCSAPSIDGSGATPPAPATPAAPAPARCTSGSSRGRWGAVLLAAGRAATTRLRLVDVGVFDADRCRPTAVRGLRVYPPGSTTSLFVPLDGRGCADDPGRAQLTVSTLPGS